MRRGANADCRRHTNMHTLTYAQLSTNKKRLIVSGPWSVVPLSAAGRFTQSLLRVAYRAHPDFRSQDRDRASGSCRMEPVSLLALDNEVTGRQIRRIWFVFPGLGNDLDEQVPGSPLQ